MTGQLATSILPQDRITVNLVARDKNGGKVNIGHIFNGEGKQIDATGAPFNGDSRSLDMGEPGTFVEAVPFDVDSFLRLLRENKKAEADEMTLIYYDESSAVGEINRTPSDRLADAVFDFCAKEYGLSEHDQEGYVLTRREILVSAPIRASEDAPALWAVTLTPKWG